MRGNPTRRLIILLILALLIPLPAYGKGPEEARRELEKLKIQYSVKEFLNRAALGDTKSIDLFLDADMDPNVKDEQHGMTALMHAIITGQTDVVVSLLGRGANINSKDNDGRTALMLAAGCTLRVSMPVEVKDWPYVIDRRLWGPIPPGIKGDLIISGGLMQLQGNPDVVKVLLRRGARADVQDDNGETALMSAARGGQVEIVKALLDARAETNVKDKNVGDIKETIEKNGHTLHLGSGWTALMYAMLDGSSQVMQALLDAGADPNASDDYGVTVLMIAALCQGHAEVATALLDASADPNAKDRDGKTALNYATDAEHKDVMEILREASTKK